MATRLSHLGETTNLLYKEQMGGRKKRSAVDAVLALVHDAEEAMNNNKIFSCLLLDVKGAFDHVALNQLLKILRELHLPEPIMTWVNCFLQNKTTSLAFDRKKQLPKDIVTGIPQGSPISPILFLIYIRNLFPQIQVQFNSRIKSPSFIDNVALTVQGDTAAANCLMLEEAVQTAFQWADENAVKFDDNKSELIHFQRQRRPALETITLPNETIISPAETVR